MKQGFTTVSSGKHTALFVCGVGGRIGGGRWDWDSIGGGYESTMLASMNLISRRISSRQNCGFEGRCPKRLLAL